MDDWMIESVNERMSEWVSEWIWMNEWIYEWMNEYINMVVKCSNEWFAVLNAVTIGSTVMSASNWARLTCIKVSMTRHWIYVRDWCSYHVSVMTMIFSYHCLVSLLRLLLLLHLITALITGDFWLVHFISLTLYYATYNTDNNN